MQNDELVNFDELLDELIFFRSSAGGVQSGKKDPKREARTLSMNYVELRPGPRTT